MNSGKYVLTAEEMREADKFTIGQLNVPSLLLMERAGVALAEEAMKMYEKASYGTRGVLCVCGGGNNGGDGFVCARILLQKGVDVAVLCLGEKFTADCKKNKEEFEKIGGEILFSYPKKRFAVAVDCMFGTGFSGELKGEYARAAEFIAKSGAKVLSADIPSGVSGSTGVAAKNAVRADKTLCIGEYKAGIFLADGMDYAGEAERADIGIALPKLVKKGDEKCEKNALDSILPYAFLTDGDWVNGVLPPRKHNVNKGTFGKTAIVAGSEEYTGAAYLSAAAALRSGAGYTSLFLPEKILPYYILKLPEALLSPLNEGGRVAFTEKNFKKLLGYDSIAFGMGTGTSEEVFKGVKYLLNAYTGRLILDADALNSLALYGKEELNELFAQKKCDVVITPHLKEFSRLTGKNISEITAEGLTAPQAFAKAHKITVLLKGAASIVTDGVRTAINTAGCAGQAKGGSGDVLSGVIAGLCATGISAFESGSAGAYLAGKAAEIACEKTGEYSLTASDEISCLGAAFLSVRR